MDLADQPAGLLHARCTAVLDRQPTQHACLRGSYARLDSGALITNPPEAPAGAGRDAGGAGGPGRVDGVAAAVGAGHAALETFLACQPVATGLHGGAHHPEVAVLGRQQERQQHRREDVAGGALHVDNQDVSKAAARSMCWLLVYVRHE